MGLVSKRWIKTAVDQQQRILTQVKTEIEWEKATFSQSLSCASAVCFHALAKCYEACSNFPVCPFTTEVMTAL